MKSEVLEGAFQKLEAVLKNASDARTSLQGNSSAKETRNRFASRIAREPRIRDAIDASCREFAAGRAWPLADDEVKIFFWDRVSAAHGFAGWLLQNGFDGPDITLEAMLTLLLVDYWQQAGVCGWMGTLIQLDRMLES
jgi:hypothetical protein